MRFFAQCIPLFATSEIAINTSFHSCNTSAYEKCAIGCVFKNNVLPLHAEQSVTLGHD